MGGATIGYELARLGRRVLFLEKGLFLHGDADEVNPLSSSVGVYQAARPPKMLVAVRGGSHIGAFEDDQRRPAVTRLVADFLRAYLERDAAADARLTDDAGTPGVLDLLAAER